MRFDTRFLRFLLGFRVGGRFLFSRVFGILRFLFFLGSGVLRRILFGIDEHDHLSAVENRHFFDDADVRQSLAELNDNIMTDACMTHFTTLELHADLDFVSVVKKTACVLELGFEIMRIDAAGKLNFLDIDRLLFLFRFLSRSKRNFP